MDREGIVAKHKTAPYFSKHSISTWYKIKNPHYSQMMGRHELFERDAATVSRRQVGISTPNSFHMDGDSSIFSTWIKFFSLV
jgi:ATP-dependent DNA ligase